MVLTSGVQGGRLTISPPLAIFDLVYESLVLLLAGSSLEAGASERLNPAGTDPKKPEGIVTGVVASRRARGDRIELWLGGREERTPPPNEWIEQLKDALGDELDMPDVRHSLSRERGRVLMMRTVEEGKIQATFLVQCSRSSPSTQDVHASQTSVFLPVYTNRSTSSSNDPVGESSVGLGTRDERQTYLLLLPFPIQAEEPQSPSYCPPYVHPSFISSNSTK